MAFRPKAPPEKKDPLKNRKVPIEIRILHILNKRKGQNVSVKDINDYTNCNAINRTDFYNALKTLQTKGMIEKIDRLYRITSKGSEHIEVVGAILS